MRSVPPTRQVRTGLGERDGAGLDRYDLAKLEENYFVAVIIIANTNGVPACRECIMGRFPSGGGR